MPSKPRRQLKTLPAPKPTVKLTVGKFYETHAGDVMLIDSRCAVKSAPASKQGPRTYYATNLTAESSCSRVMYTPCGFLQDKNRHNIKRQLDIEEATRLIRKSQFNAEKANEAILKEFEDKLKIAETRRPTRLNPIRIHIQIDPNGQLTSTQT